jgi:hypothetical protein
MDYVTRVTIKKGLWHCTPKPLFCGLPLAFTVLRFRMLGPIVFDSPMERVRRQIGAVHLLGR